MSEHNDVVHSVRELRDQAERRFSMGEWVDKAHLSTLQRDSGNSLYWGAAAGTYSATVSHLSDMAMFMAGCENRCFGDERWLAFAIWINGLKGWTPQEVLDDLPMWRTADQ